MLGSRKDLKDQITANRGKARGVKSPTVTPHKTNPKNITNMLDDPVVDEYEPIETDLQNQAELLEEVVKRVEQEAKIKAKIDGFVQKKIESVRNRRLRNGEGTLSKSALRSLKSQLREEAERKFSKAQPIGDTYNSHQREPNDLPDGQEDVDENIDNDGARILGCEASHMQADGAPIKFNLENRFAGVGTNSKVAATKPKSKKKSVGSTPKPSGKTQSSSKSKGTRGTTVTKSTPPKTPATRTETVNKRGKNRNKKQIADSTNASQESVPYTFVSDDTTSFEDDNEDKWWAQEEAKWKKELEARRHEGNFNGMNEVVEDDDDDDDDTSNESDELENDIRLRTQIISKLPTDHGLGVQLYTPKNEHGVRITKITPDGPFGRTQSFAEGDVIVEINGIPLLYAGHESVFQTIKSEIMQKSEMSVTVCSPQELVKLEALVKNEGSNDATTGQTDSDSRSSTIWKSWKNKLKEIKSPNKEQMKQWLKPMLKIFDQKPRDSATTTMSDDATSSSATSSSLTGAPAWWKDSKGKTVAKATSRTSQSSFGVREREPAYLIYRADIRDLEEYKANYMSETTRIISKYGGRWLARGGKVTTFEGGNGEDEQTVLQRMVLIEFPNIDAATDFFQSEEYQLARSQRLSIASVEITVLEGMPQE